MLHKILFAIFATSLLCACGGTTSDKEIIFNDTVGPNTRVQTEQLPSGLKGDTDKANHIRGPIPQDMDPKEDGGRR